MKKLIKKTAKAPAKKKAKKPVTKRSKVTVVPEIDDEFEEEEESQVMVVGDVEGPQEKAVPNITTTDSIRPPVEVTVPVSEVPTITVGEAKGATGPKGEEAVTKIVTVTMLEEIDPSPVVGRINMIRDFKIMKLDRGRTYNLPYCVAIVLLDRGKAIPARLT